MARRSFVSQLIALPFLGMTAWGEQATRKPLKIMMKSAWGSDDPTKAAFPFLHGLALSEAGHSVQIFLLGEAVSVMRKTVVSAIVLELKATEALPKLRQLLGDNERSNFGKLESVTEAAQAAIAKLQSETAR
jgi:predicted peroxiredoxin